MPRRTAPIAWTVWTATAAVCALNVALFHGRVQNPPPTDGPSRLGEVLFLLMPLVFVSVGALVATHRRDNPIGWLLCLGFGSTALYAFMSGYAWTGLVIDPGGLPAATLAGWVTNWLWVPGAIAMVLVLLLFPDGHLLSPRWRPVVWLIVATFVLICVAAALMPGALNNIRSVENPLGWDTVEAPSHAIFFLAGPLLVVALLVSVVAIALRFRRSRETERQQLKWLAFAASFTPLAGLNSFVPVFGSFSLLVMRLVFSAIAAAIGVAILRYRLYDIDLLINRTLVYGTLSAAIVGVYIVVVGYLGALFRTGRGRGEPAGACAGCGAGWASRNRERRRRTGLLTSTGYRVDGPADARHRRRRGHSRDHHGASISRCRHADHVRGRRLGVRGIRAGARSQR